MNNIYVIDNYGGEMKQEGIQRILKVGSITNVLLNASVTLEFMKALEI